MPLASLWQHRFVHREPGSGTRETVERELANRHLALPPGPCFGSIEALKRAVAAGGGLAFISSLAVQDELRRGELVAAALARHGLRARSC